MASSASDSCTYRMRGVGFLLENRRQSMDDSYVSASLSSTEAKHLLQLCKTGRLFDVQNWISSGKSLSVPAELRTTLLKVAIDTGFLARLEDAYESRYLWLVFSTSTEV